MGVFAILACLAALAAGPSGVTIPKDGDEFSKLVARSEADDRSVDFRALRLAWLDSAARKRAQDTDDLRTQMNKAADGDDAKSVRDAAQQIASQAYVDMEAHVFLRQSCELLGDKACADHEHFVEFGLLQSITSDRDGKTLKTAWQVISVDEEYFVLAAAGLRMEEQSLINGDGRAYDRMAVVAKDGSKAVYYFDITDFFGKEFQ